MTPPPLLQQLSILKDRLKGAKLEFHQESRLAIPGCGRRLIFWRGRVGLKVRTSPRVMQSSDTGGVIPLQPGDQVWSASRRETQGGGRSQTERDEPGGLSCVSH